MSPPVHESLPPVHVAHVMDVYESLETPEGWRSEIIEAEIVLVPPPSVVHEHILDHVRTALRTVLPRSWGMSTHSGLVLPSLFNVAIPDLLVTDVALMDAGYAPNGGVDWAVRLEHVELVVEVTSTNAMTDRDVKRVAYGKAGIPRYLLVDRERHEVTLFTEPHDLGYGNPLRVPYGESLTVDFGEAGTVEITTDAFPK
ncbi:Uma2 family endonuclease [Streptomyces antimicrobicus]|uniref:Uma2 family endonuclease n=1 Tax=Streptomyces antimicrobicus TaxID=2883108 RepID=A0ABS8B1P5_9ACTN|nr:Uma2 family endonuclease [Streptomyces antimicrobicus]MCB5178487.1 Uma2 family endonuclease [Streptomyces antimicrobicus]